MTGKTITLDEKQASLVYDALVSMKDDNQTTLNDPEFYLRGDERPIEEVVEDLEKEQLDIDALLIALSE